MICCGLFVLVFIVRMIRIIEITSFLCILSLPDSFAYKSEGSSDLILTHIVSNFLSRSQLV